MNGKLPPQALEVENIIIGAILIDRDAMPQVVNILTEKMFYKEDNAIIFQSAYELHKNNRPIDLLTITEQLRSDGKLEIVGGAYNITKKCNAILSIANVEYHCYIVRSKFLLRQLITIGATLTERGYDDSEKIDELIEWVENAIFNLTKDNFAIQEKHIMTLFREQIKNIDDKKSGLIIGYYTLLRELDKVLNGVKKQNMIVVAGRASMGKTAFCLSVARNMSVEHKVPVAFFSMEMSASEVCARFTALNSDIPLNYIVNLNVRGVMHDKMMYDLPTVKDTPLYIDDSPSLTVMILRNKIRKMIKKYKIEVVFVDYLQLMRGETNKGTRENEVSECSRGVKAIAKEFDIPIFAMAQLSRAVEGRGDKRPQLSDLRESGSIEQDADVVILLFRPEYYGIKNDENGQSLPKGYTEAMIRKHRNGGLGDVKLQFIDEVAKFQDFKEDEYINYTNVTERKDVF